MYFLGLDLSTQRLKATIINENGEIINEENIHFDQDLPHYKTKDGVHVKGPQVTSPVLMWCQALELLFDKIDKNLLSSLKGISGSGQQHASVYWQRFPTSLDPKVSLTKQLEDQNVFSILDSPIWMDMSTGEYCKKLENSAGSPQKLADLTGSSAYERFTGNQIAKIATLYPDDYANTEKISLASSFIPSLLLGHYTAIDPSDGSGMNLLNIKTKEWDPLLASCCGGDSLIDKLGKVGSENNEVLGTISSYFQTRYNIPNDCIISTFSGDNPCTLASIPTAVGDLIISLGTSDTCMFVDENPTPVAGVGHVFCSPTLPNAFMAMICFRNGSLAREKIRNTYSQNSWEKFNQQIQESSIDDTLGFYFPDSEIIPPMVGTFFFKNGQKVDSIADSLHARAIIQSQTLMKKFYCEKLGLNPKRIIVVGGGSKNGEIVKIIANAFGLDTYELAQGNNSASLGACYRALYAFQRDQDQSYENFLLKIHPGLVKIAKPDMDQHRRYNELNFEDIMKSFDR